MTAQSIPRGNPDSLVRAGETPATALARIEKRKDYARIIGSPAGQALLEAVASDDQAARQGRPSSIVCPRCLGPLAKGEVHEPGECTTTPPAPVRLPESGPRASLGSLELVRIDEIDVATNVREDLGDLEELAASIRENGVVEPIHVHRVGERFVVDVGHRRLAAAKIAGNNYVPAVVDGALTSIEDQAERSIVQLVENLQRRDLGPLEEAKAFRAILAAEPDLNQAKLAARIGRSAPYVSNALRLLELAPEVQELLAGGQLTAAHAKPLVGLAPKTQAEIGRGVARDGVSSHEVENRVADHKRQEEWRKNQEEQSRKNAEQHREILEAAIASLAKKKVALDAPIRVVGYGEADIFIAAAKKAGYTDVAKGSWQTIDGRPKGVDCDCGVWKVTAEYGRVTIAPGCQSKEHQAAKRTLDDAKRTAKNAAETRVHDRLAMTVPKLVSSGQIGSRTIVLDELPARMALWMALDWHLADWSVAQGGKRTDPWSTIAGLSDIALADELGKSLAANFRDHYGYHIGWAQIGETLGVDEKPTPAADPDDAFDAPVLEEDVPTCRICGCTDEHACVGGCSWVPDPDSLGDLCSACADDVAIREASA